MKCTIVSDIYEHAVPPTEKRNDSEPKLTLQNTWCKMKIANTKILCGLLNMHYNEHLEARYIPHILEWHLNKKMQW